ncbi:MAG: asparagine synthase (glutamine-hydrolyzing) [Micavibrio aeruginosavorus]|uniref:asparagine synthase (glutamine-hydrolyzing) n=1 Tax=Micavibrio aeruginosavorus TaxID=349221 RepID=A0A7T5R2H0_9BACT|nr:MAG: asparagine synthase (glutamine-hydrolyzing) [Micavibrio aeruginosavorus]
MCGIAGCRLSRPLTPDDLAVLRTLRDSLSHRGPDDQGEWYDSEKGIYLGHRRLSIIDLDQRSAQPMTRDHLRIVYNGETYNYKEIRESLGNRFHFTTEGDTEVVLRAWQNDGAKTLERFDGMFALALYDEETQELVLATDAFGEKPLFYYQTNEGVFFASEAGALIKTFNLSFTPDESEIADFLFLGYIRPPQTGFRGLMNMTPASLARIKADGKMQVSRWWRPAPPIQNDSARAHPFTEEERNRLRDILCRSLALRLRADVPIGLFLSGGVDSSLLAALASRELGIALQTYTVSFPDGMDESRYAAHIAQHLGLPHRTISSAESGLWQDSPRALLDFYGIPNDNMTVLAVEQMCKTAKPFLTVALSGIGGDELFYGYNKYATLYKRRHLYRHAAVAHSVLRKLSSVHQKFYMAAEMLKGTPSRQYLRLKNGPAMSDMESLSAGMPEIFDHASCDLVHQVRLFDLTSSMPQSYIPATDRGSMRAAVEVRAPFLCRELYDFSSSLGLSRLMAFGCKSLPRDLLRRYLPPHCLTPGKQGFTFPAGRYLTQPELITPVVPFWDGHEVDALWAKRAEPDYQTLALRLAILSELSRERRAA